jgi:aconitate hydratase
VLEVLAQSGSLVDLVATGARILEPDHRVVSGKTYPPPAGTLSIRTADPEPRVPGTPSFVVASAETLAYAVATGCVGDPRSFKRPVRVTVPRALPTDDVLILRDKKGVEAPGKKAPLLPVAVPWKTALSFDLVKGLPRVPTVPVVAPKSIPAAPVSSSSAAEPSAGLALLLSTLDEVRDIAQRASEIAGLRVVIAAFLPSNVVSALASEGVAAFAIEASAIEGLKDQKTLSLPAPGQWGDAVQASAGKTKVELRWLAIGVERGWTHAGSGRTIAKGKA